jgi:hypothetical protein
LGLDGPSLITSRTTSLDTGSTLARFSSLGTLYWRLFRAWQLLYAHHPPIFTTYKASSSLSYPRRVGEYLQWRMRLAPII